MVDESDIHASLNLGEDELKRCAYCERRGGGSSQAVKPVEFLGVGAEGCSDMRPEGGDSGGEAPAVGVGGRAVGNYGVDELEENGLGFGGVSVGEEADDGFGAVEGEGEEEDVVEGEFDGF